MTADLSRTNFTIAASAAVGALMFAMEPETYPVFEAWAKKNAMYPEALTFPVLQSAALYLGNEAISRYPDPPGP